MARTKDRDKSLPTLVSELWQLVLAYVRQETLVPIRGLGRYVALGLAGSALFSVGGVLLALALLRFVQDVGGDTLDGNLSWVPYLITLALTGAAAAYFATRIGANKRKARS